MNNDPMTLDDAFAGAWTYEGHRYVDLGEDDDELLITGHPEGDTVQAIAAAYAEEVGGDVPDDLATEQRWAAFRPHKADCEGGDECRCDQFGWWIDFGTAETTFAFPGYYAVTVVTW